MNKGMYSSVPDEKFAQKSAILKDSAESKLNMVQRGSVTEITLGGRTFQVSDPKRIEQTVTILKNHEEAMHTMRQRLKEQHNAIAVLLQEIQTLKNDVQRLKEITNGYGSQEYNGY
jgi:cell shape-determining protein MreC